MGAQYIRAAAILQTLLGNMGRPGGGILAPIRAAIRAAAPGAEERIVVSSSTAAARPRSRPREGGDAGAPFVLEDGPAGRAMGRVVDRIAALLGAA